MIAETFGAGPTMRVLFWSETFWPKIGGSEVMATTLIDGLRRLGHEFIVLTRLESDDQPARDRYDGVDVHRFRVRDDQIHGPGVVDLIPIRQEVARIKREFRPDLVHVSLPGPTVVLHLWTAAIPHPCPTLVSLHVALTPDELAAGSPTGQALRRSSWVTACSNNLLEQVRSALPEIRARSSVVPNALPIPTREPSPLPIDAPRLLCLGRLEALKGFDTAIEAFAAVLGRFPSARLIVAGDGPERTRLERLAGMVAPGSAVEFRGWVDPRDVPTLLDEATLVLIPSRSEAFGLVALQAAQMGRPVVASNVGGIPEMVVDGETGRLVEPDDVDRWAGAIVEILGDPERLARLGRQARSLAARFGVDPFLSEFERLYQEIAGCAGRPGSTPGT